VAATKMVPSFFLGGGSTTCRNYNASKQEIYSESNKGKHKEPRVWNIKPKNAARYIDFRICQIVVAPLAVYNKLRQPEDVGGG